jgi:choice-of-anchor C domain-containing protein
MKLVPKLLVIVAILSNSNAWGVNLVANGSFEEGPPIPGTLLTINAPDGTTLPGWMVASNDLEIITNAEWPAAEGTRSIDLNGVTNASMYQDLANLVIGSPYRLTFALSGNPFINGDPIGTADALKDLRVSVAGTDTDFVFDVTPYHWPAGSAVPNMGWRTETLVFVANSSSQRLQFSSLDPFSSTRGPAIDSVSVILVPEPAVQWLAAFSAIAAWVRRRWCD